MKLFWALILFLIVLQGVNAAETVDVTITETGKITNYLDTYWVVNVHGEGTLYNPSSRELFNVRLPYSLGTLDIVSGQTNPSLDSTGISFGTVSALDTISFSYDIIGITASQPAPIGQGILYYAMNQESAKIYSDVFGELKKGSLEDETITGRPGRLVSVTLDNPTGLPYNIDFLRVIKTSDLNPNNVLEEWLIIDENNPIILESDGFFKEDIYDLDSAEGQVYWLQSEVYISSLNFVDASNITYFTERNLSLPPPNITSPNQTSNASRNLITSSYVLRKQISETVISLGAVVTVDLLLYNLADTPITYELEDYLPFGFVANEDLSWKGAIAPRSSRIESYNVYMNESGFGGIDIFPAAQATFDGNDVRSQEVAFIRQFSPDHRVYLQKKINYRDSDTVSITLSVQNLGPVRIEGITLKEFLDDEVLFSEISKAPAGKGTWEINQIKSGETWTVNYVTESGEQVNTLPAIYGVPSSALLRSIILESVVSQKWSTSSTRWIEFAGIGSVIVVILLVFGAARLYRQ